MPWTFTAIVLLIGMLLGFLLAKMTSPQSNKQKSLKKELDATKFELEQHKQELVDHFASSSELVEELGKSYRRLHKHMASSSNTLLPNLPKQDHPFAEQIEFDSENEKKVEKEKPEIEKPEEETQPKDYAKGATGMLKEPEKVIVDAPDVIKPV